MARITAVTDVPPSKCLVCNADVTDADVSDGLAVMLHDPLQGIIGMAHLGHFAQTHGHIDTLLLRGIIRCIVDKMRLQRKNGVALLDVHHRVIRDVP